MSEYKTGILGASSWLARELLGWMEKWRLPCVVQLFDTQEACGTVLRYQDHYVPIHNYDEQITACQLLFDCRNSQDSQGDAYISKHSYVIHLEPRENAGDMIVPNVNIDTLTNKHVHCWIPSAAFLSLASILSLLTTQCKLTYVTMTSLHSVADLGYEGYTDLMNQIHSYQEGKELESKQFPLKDAYQHLPLLFQALPQTSCLCEQGCTCEELWIQQQMKHCIQQPIDLSATCVRVAGLRGLSMSITCEYEGNYALDMFLDAFASDPNFICIDDISHNMYPICADVIHDYRIYIGRMRNCTAHSFSAWAVCDDLAIRCGAACKVGLYMLHNFL